MIEIILLVVFKLKKHQKLILQIAQEQMLKLSLRRKKKKWNSEEYKILSIRENSSDSETQPVDDDDDDDVIIEDYNTPDNQSPVESCSGLVISPSENPDEQCDRFRLFFREQQNGNDENGLDDDIVATFDKLMENKRNTSTKRKKNKFTLLKTFKLAKRKS